MFLSSCKCKIKFERIFKKDDIFHEVAFVNKDLL